MEKNVSIFKEMTASEYHDDPCHAPSLSSGIAKILLNKSPYHAYCTHPKLGGSNKKEDVSRKMEIGSVVHKLLLGRGADFSIIEADDYRKNSAKEERDNALINGKIPILKSDFETAKAMAHCAMKRINDDDPLFFPADSEVVGIIENSEGCFHRAMFDKLDIKNGIIWDVKTTSSGANPAYLGYKIANMGYDISFGHYENVLAKIAPELSGRIKFRWIFIETEPPYEISIVELDGTGREMGRRKAAYAAEIWKKCITENEWPGYPRGITEIKYPAFAERSWLENEYSYADQGIVLSTFGNS